MPMIRLDSVEKALGARRFAYDLTLDGGGIVAVTGPSGSGKSTLFHLLAGFETPDLGHVLIDGADMAGVSPGERPLTYIFQDHNLFAHLDVATNVAIGISPRLKLSAEDKDRVQAALARVGLTGFGRRMPQALSGGERQRVAFARAMVRRRPLLLLDEPFASLDEQLRREMGDLLAELREASDIMVLMISHDASEIARLADSVVTIDGGRIGFSGSTEEWLKRRQERGHNYTQA
ncbi:thiamine ABC transporter ATP-binding protein [Rhizobium sp.]